MLRMLLSELEGSDPVDRMLQMKVLKDLGAVALDLGESDAATAYYGAALTWANDIGDIAGLISIYNGLAYVYRARGDLDAAMGYLQKALGATEVSNDLVHATVIHNALAVIAAERGHLQVAVQHAERAVQIARTVGPLSYVASCLNTKAECAFKLREWESARTYAEEALAVALQAGAERVVAASRVMLGDIALATGHPDEGERQLGEAAAIYRTAEARSELGEVLMRLSRSAQARAMNMPRIALPRRRSN